MSIASKILEAVKPVLNEDEKTASALKALADAKPSDDNKDQGKFAEIMKGLAFSDDPAATAFMKKLMGTITPEYVGSKKNEANIMAACKGLCASSTDEEIEAVAKKSGHPFESVKKIAKGKKKMENDDEEEDDKKDDEKEDDEKEEKKKK